MVNKIYSENDVQKAIHEIMRDYGIKFYHREKYRKLKYGNRYDFDGMFDTIIWLPRGKVINVEIKKEKEDLKEKQIEWHEYLLKNDHECYILRLEETNQTFFDLCIEDFKSILRFYGVPVK